MLGTLTFAAPWLLLGLFALPLLWWLLRAVPPAPRLVPFPAIRLLFGLKETEETPHRTPWWLLALRLLLAALLIVGLAQPLLNPSTPLEKDGPLVLVVDDAWTAGANWSDTVAMAEDLIAQAERQRKPVMMITTAPAADGSDPLVSDVMLAADARRQLRAMEPKPWAADYEAARRAWAEQLLLQSDLDGNANVYWLSSGAATVDGRAGASDEATALRAFGDELGRAGTVRMVLPEGHQLPVMLKRPTLRGTAFVAHAERADGGARSRHQIDIYSDDGRSIAQAELAFAAGATTAEAVIDMPSELRNAATQMRLDGEETAGAVILIDEQFRRRPVGIVSGASADRDQPLIGDRYYLERALAPYAELRDGKIGELLARDLAVMILADVGTLTDEEAVRLGDWIESGGVLTRFAGPHLAEGRDDLLPVYLRQGGRTFGGVMSWDTPSRLAPFDRGSPFAGLAAPDDVVVTRQVLAEPGPDLAAKTWARLEDGTPLVTAERRGDGWLILVHTTANTDWSNLALSGLYVDMLRRILALSQGVTDVAGDTPLPPLTVIDGFGRFAAPPAAAVAITGEAFDDTAPGPRTPPGFYGTDLARRALNLGAFVDALTPIDGGVFATWPDGFVEQSFARVQEVDLKPWFLTAALMLLLADFVISLVLRGLMPRLGRPRIAVGGTGAALVAGLACFGAAMLAAPSGGLAQGVGSTAGATPEQFAIDAAGAIHLAYMRTGVSESDRIAEAGLRGLGSVLAARTSIEPAEPVGLDPEINELAFFSLIYWRVAPGQADLSDAALERINTYLRHGGMIMFDTADQQFTSSGTGSPGVERLQSLVGSLDLPPLHTVPSDHVLTKAFYLMSNFPGRWDGGTLWVQRPSEHVNDGVSSIIVGANDYASAWALDSIGRPLYPVSPGGERQREMAYRFGVNLVMYALTGNYKADQVHVPAILERLGQ